MSYLPPQDVTSPQEHWTLGKVLRDGGPGQDCLAIGHWYSKPVLASRWNGAGQDDKGFPLSHRWATWFIEPRWRWAAILLTAQISETDRDEAARFLGLSA